MGKKVGVYKAPWRSIEPPGRERVPRRWLVEAVPKGECLLDRGGVKPTEGVNPEGERAGVGLNGLDRA